MSAAPAAAAAAVLTSAVEPADQEPTINNNTTAAAADPDADPAPSPPATTSNSTTTRKRKHTPAASGSGVPSTPTPAEFVGRTVWSKLDTPLHGAIARITKRYQKRIQRGTRNLPAERASLVKAQNYARRNGEIAEFLRGYGIAVENPSPPLSPAADDDEDEASPAVSPVPERRESGRGKGKELLREGGKTREEKTRKPSVLVETLEASRTAAVSARNTLTALRYVASHCADSEGAVEAQIAMVENFAIAAERYVGVLMGQMQASADGISGENAAAVGVGDG
ncbi:hypothetical protein BZA05DRAFT_83084 [Tricharina praecox]|uniref:uncharacterized protein n=1 Tax=Tricharina praecox TaxID=43433 RepID=UPI00221F8D41|nr:uncharacterized protein BZA05DRAFT_83084 [Tricharina praecox]KAI5849106.1 hypothetical protein BZA05DRAFT_83084 [Tricharina praecox]